MDSEQYADQIRLCASCPKLCRHVCPTFSAWRSNAPTPHGRAILLHYEAVGARNLDDRAVEVIYQCLQCSHCLTWCIPEVDIASIVEMTRERLVSEDRYPSGLDRLKQSVDANHNPFGEPHGTRTSWYVTEGGEVTRIVYFTGCTASYREQSIAVATVELLRSIGYQVLVLDDEWCCGSPLLRTGFVPDALVQAEHNVEVLNSIDAEAIVATCPGCYKTLVKDYPEHGLSIRIPVRHISDLLDEKLSALDESDFSEVITYHDPCHLGRHSGVYDAPREVIRKISGVEVSEMKRNRENATCCGNGAGLRTLFPDAAKRIGSSRIQDAKDVGARVLVTSCPFCKNMLKGQADESLDVFDLPEFVLGMTQRLNQKDE